MSAFLIIAIMAAIVIILAMVWTSFRRWLGRQFALIGALIGRFFPVITAWVGNALRVIAKYIGIYAFILLIIVIASIILMGIAILIGYPGLTGFIFVLCLGLILLAWLPAGLIMRLFRVTDGVVPTWLKTIIGVTAFIGFVGLVFPEILTFSVLTGLTLIGFIFAAGTRKTNIIDKIIIPVTILMIAVVAWKYIAPEGFRSSTRYVASWSKVFNTTKDRGSINNETEAATTYAIALKDINVLYEISEKGDVTMVEEEISKGDTIRLLSHREEVIIIDGQGLLKIQLRNSKGTFLSGPKYWVEAEFVQIASPREIVSKRSSKKDEPTVATPVVSTVFPNYTTLEKGTVVFELKAGEETPWFTTVPGGWNISSPGHNYIVRVSDGTEYQGEANVPIPAKTNCYYKLVAKSDQLITFIVLGR